MKTGTKSLIWYYYKSTHTHTQHKWVKPNPCITVCLENRQRANLFVEYNSTRQKKEKKKCERRKRDKGQNGRRDGRKRRRTSNAARRNEKPDGREINIEPVARDGTENRYQGMETVRHKRQEDQC